MSPADGDWEVAASGLAFPEALRWHEGCLWLSDIMGREVLRIPAGGQAEVVCRVARQPSGLGWRPDGTLLVVEMQTRRLLSWSGAELRTVSDLSALTAGSCNDMVVDVRGRAYVGDFGYDYVGGEERRAAHLTLVDATGVARTVAEDVWFPNGMAISPDGRTLLVAETPACRISAFRIEADGSLGDRRIHADLGTARPDGICLDAEGALWIASPGTCELVRVAADGKLLESLTMPGGTPAQTCVLGGADGRSLFVASTPSHDEQTALSTRAGTVFVRTVDVPAATRTMSSVNLDMLQAGP